MAKGDPQKYFDAWRGSSDGSSSDASVVDQKRLYNEPSIEAFQYWLKNAPCVNRFVRHHTSSSDGSSSDKSPATVFS
jgi:hypothetical protein